MIRLDDYEESEDLTADMVRAWLRKEGWREEPRGGWTPPGRQIEGGLRVICMADVITPTDGIPEMLTAIQHYTKRSVQSLLREINPRMRAGWPSEEERAKHRYWIAQEDVGSIDSLHIGCFDEDDEDGTPVFVAGDDLWTEEDVRRLDMKFWPCDQHGNKTRRGA